MWPWKCWSVTAVHCASLERTRRPWATKVKMEELGFCEMWVVCGIQWDLAKHSVLGVPQVPVWKRSRCPSAHCQLVLLTALCVSCWVVGCLICVCSLDLWTLLTAQLKVILLLQPDAWETCCSVSTFLAVRAARAREL